MRVLKLALLASSALLFLATATSPREPATASGKPELDGRRRKRHQRDLLKLPRSAAISQLYHAAEAAAPPNFPPESLFAPSAIWRWIRNYLAYVFRPKHVFPPYSASPTSALYDLRGNGGSKAVRIALAGDWGTGTEEAEQVSERMKEFDPHFTIHIGDVYYVGDPLEVNENCLGVRNPNNNYDPVTWPIGSLGSFAMNGNHEMYANGCGYFDVFLPKIGLRERGEMQGQQTSFFCLQNDIWRVIAIDTGYNSVGIPVLEQIPFIKKVPGVGGNCRLPDQLIAWLHEVVLTNANDERGTVILSHQQYYSGFEDQFSKPAEQLWEAGIRSPVLWFWGHEHRLAGYDLQGTGKLKAFGRCVGHGGMPLSLGQPRPDRLKPLFYDARMGSKNFGVNGHVNLLFEDSHLTVSYVDLTGQIIQTEEWSVDKGAVRLDSRTKHIADPDFHA